MLFLSRKFKYKIRTHYPKVCFNHHFDFLCLCSTAILKLSSHRQAALLEISLIVVEVASDCCFLTAPCFKSLGSHHLTVVPWFAKSQRIPMQCLKHKSGIPIAGLIRLGLHIEENRSEAPSAHHIQARISTLL